MISLFSQGKFFSVWQYSPRDALLHDVKEGGFEVWPS